MNAFDEPAGIHPRGTVLVAAGRGETADTYQRFGRRIAADGYRVRILPDVTADLATSFTEAEKLLVDDGLPAPRVVVGSDTGALFARALAARGAPGLDGLVLAGLPVPRPAGINLLGWDAELDARTGCPTHRGVLTTSLFSAQVPTELVGPIGNVSVPTLGLHGDADPISPLDEALPAYPGEVTVINGGKHDALNDLSHRTVAATVVIFLERLRNGAAIIR